MADLNGDGIDDAFESTGRTAMMVAMQLGEKLGRVREELRRDAAARDDAVAREMTARLEAERGAARAELRVVDQLEWWDRATPQDVARVLETAETWKGQDDVAAGAFQLIEQQVRTRYGVDLSDFQSAAVTERSTATREEQDAALLVAEAERLERGSGPVTPGKDAYDDTRHIEEDLRFSAALAWGEDTSSPAYQRLHAGVDVNNPDAEDQISARSAALDELVNEWRVSNRITDEETERPFLVAENDRLGEAVAAAYRSEAAHSYDSAGRRRAMANEMENAGIASEDIHVRLRVDAGQGLAAEAAVAGGTSAGTRAPRGPQVRGSQRLERTR